VGWQSSTGEHLTTSVRAILNFVFSCQCANLRLGITEIAQRAERDAAHAVAGCTALTVNLEATLQLTLVVGAERASKRPVLLHRLHERVFSGLGGTGNAKCDAGCCESLDERVHFEVLVYLGLSRGFPGKP